MLKRLFNRFKAQPVRSSRAPDYTDPRVTTIGVDDSQPDPSIVPVGTKVKYRHDKKHRYNNRAIELVTEKGLRVGELFNNELQDMVLECLNNGCTVIGEVTYYNRWELEATMNIYMPRRDPSIIIPVNAEEFGRRIVSARKKQKLTQRQLSDACGIPVPVISCYENGKTLYIKSRHVEEISSALGVTPEWLTQRSE